ncbi:putative hemagglutinin-related protein [Dialister sp. CAG:486]|nr:putative hemagglutinin-related protein [Dialister sp. CAG:486]
MKSIPSMSLKTKAMKSLGRKILCVLLSGVFFGDTIAWAEAPILPDTTAPGNRYPLVQETANGIPLVNISAPTAGGVSRNDYERFNIPTKGAILNNSYTLSKTELAGYVQGNANMAQGPAKIIVNQVASGNPTTMNGFLEVAGHKADVIIANPNGITVNGGGFINTARAILTTGKPEYDNKERLKDFRIDNDATILITGNGLNGKKADTLELYTRAAEIKAAIFGNTVHVTTGANVIDANTGKVTAIEGKGKKPEIAIDVKDLGGMYAGRIFLIGNEKGLPIDIKGAIESQHMVLDNQGNLYHAGTTHSTEDMTIHAKDIQNTGTMAASGNMTLRADGQVVNDKIMGSVGNMAITANQVTNHKTIASEKDLSITTTIEEENALDNSNSEILANGNVTIQASHTDNLNGNIASGTTLSIQGKTLNNSQGKLTAYGSSTISLSDKLENEQGLIAANENISISSDRIHNAQGAITAGQNETITTKDIQLDGKLAAGNNLTITTDNDITNDSAKENYGITQADGNLTISAKGNLTNSKKLESKGTLTLSAKDISNKESGEINGGSVSITSTTLTNRGLVSADQANTITTDILQNIATGRIYGEDITLHAKTLENRKDKVLEEKLAAAMKDLKQKGKDLDDAFAIDVTAFKSDSEKENYFKEIEHKQAAYAASKAAVDAILADMAQVKSATIAARNDMIITGDTLLNSASSLLYAGGDMSISEAKDITNQGADIKAQGNMSLTAPTITNANEAFSAKRVWTSEVTNPDLIRIDEDGHPEKGQSFTRNEFSALDSGYGAYHNKGITPKTLYEEAGYDKIEQITEEERKDGETPVPDELVGQEAPNYDYNDPIFKELGVKSMDTPRPGYDDPKQADWDKQYKEILNQLNEKIKAYNEEAKAYNDSIGAIESKAIKNYTIIRTTTHTSEKQVQETKAGNISSGKDMILSGNVTNENSRITAGSTLTANSGTLDNIAEKNQVQKITFGTTQESYTKRKHRPHKAWRRHYRDQIFMTPQKELDNPTSLDVGSYEGNTGKNPNKEDITQTMRDNVQQHLNPFATGKETNPGSTAGKETGGTLSFIPDSSLYKLHPEEKAKYLIETDPAFTNKKTFLSSDYMYNQLLWDNDKVNKRLGDGFYEQELIRNQVTQLTGMRYLNGYTNDEEEYKALMNAGIAYAKEYNLKPGISLSKEQMASLTSDIVWLETTTVTVNGKTYTVLYPHVYLKASTAKVLTEDGSLISANTLITDTKGTLTNQGTLKGNTIVVKSKNIVNTGTIFGNDLSLKANQDILQSGIIEGEDRISLDAGRNITMKNTIQHGKNQDILDTTAGIAVKGQEGVLLMQAGQDITMTGATLAALGKNGSMIFSAGHNLTMDTDSLEAKKDMTENSDNYIRTYRKTETANTLTAGKDISLISGNDIKARSTTVASENGQISMKAADDVTIENGYNKAMDDYGLKYKESGFLSHKTTAIKSHDERKTAIGSMLSGDKISITSIGNTTITASNVVGTNDVSITSGKNTTITSAEEVEQHDYEKRVKKSGLLSGGGLGFTIGTEKRKDQYSDADLLQKASTVGSVSGNVSIESGNKTEVGASAVLAGKNISITGENVQISSKDNVYHSDEKHEYRKSGLTVSVGGDTIKALQKVEAPLAKATAVSDNRLKALYGYEAYDTVKSDLKGENSALKDLSSGKVHLAVSVGIGSTSSQSENHSVRTEAQGSTLSAGENVSIQAKSDMEIKGSAVEGENVTWHVGQNLTITSAEETQQQNMTESSKGGSLGVSISAHAPITVEGSLYAGKGKENDTSVSYKESTIQARNELTSHSGKDTNLIGSTLSGGKVTMNIGGNMNITSQQASHHYTSENASAGMHVSTLPGKVNLTGNASRGSMRSDFDSVTSQSGIHAGNDGYEITVKENTRLKGGLIDSVANADKNRLTTGTLAWEDMKNSADYKAGGLGISYASKDEGTRLNERGLTPSISPTIRGSADSTTKSAVSEWTITITDREHQKQDISKLNRDTKNSLNQLQEIFDKTKVEEKQELVGMLEKYGNQAIHTYAESKGWKDGSTEKMLLHGAFGALMGDMAGGSAATGALSGGVNEYVMGYLTKEKGEDWVQKHPDTVQWIAAGVGAALGNLTDGDMAEAVNTALAATKWNKLAYESMTKADIKDLLRKANGNQMSDKEIEGLLTDIISIVNKIDPEAAQSKYYEYGNAEAVNAVKECLKEHGISDENITSFMNEYEKVYREAAKKDIELFKKRTGIDLAKHLIDSSVRKGTFELPGLLVTANRNHPLLEECEHSDMYEAQRDLERNLDADLIESRRELGTKIAAESPAWANENYGGLKIVGFVGAEVAEKMANTPIASKFLRYSLEGSGELLSFEHGSDVSKDLEQSDVLAAKVRELSQNLKPGEQKYFYSSMDFNNGDKNSPSKDQQLAYGKVKLAISIEKDAKGNITYNGKVGDTYNFDWHAVNQSSYKNEHIKLIMNNGAVLYQEIGALQPFNWTASISGHVHGGNEK